MGSWGYEIGDIQTSLGARTAAGASSFMRSLEPVLPVTGPKKGNSVAEGKMIQAPLEVPLGLIWLN